MVALSAFILLSKLNKVNFSGNCLLRHSRVLLNCYEPDLLGTSLLLLPSEERSSLRRQFKWAAPFYGGYEKE